MRSKYVCLCVCASTIIHRRKCDQQSWRTLLTTLNDGRHVVAKFFYTSRVLRPRDPYYQPALRWFVTRTIGLVMINLCGGDDAILEVRRGLQFNVRWLARGPHVKECENRLVFIRSDAWQESVCWHFRLIVSIVTRCLGHPVPTIQDVEMNHTKPLQVYLQFNVSCRRQNARWVVQIIALQSSQPHRVERAVGRRKVEVR